MTERNTEGWFVRKRTYTGGRDSDMTVVERRAERMEQAAVKLLETVLRRQRWSAIDKQRIAAFLDDLVVTEIERRTLAEARKAARQTPH